MFNLTKTPTMNRLLTSVAFLALAAVASAQVTITREEAFVASEGEQVRVLAAAFDFDDIFFGLDLELGDADFDPNRFYPATAFDLTGFMGRFYWDGTNGSTLDFDPALFIGNDAGGFNGTPSVNRLIDTSFLRTSPNSLLFNRHLGDEIDNDALGFISVDNERFSMVFNSTWLRDIELTFAGAANTDGPTTITWYYDASGVPGTNVQPTGLTSTLPTSGNGEGYAQLAVDFSAISGLEFGENVAIIGEFSAANSPAGFAALDNLQITGVVVPEPATNAAIALGAVLVVLAVRRFRR